MAKNLIVRFSHNFFCHIIANCLNFFYKIKKKFFECYFNSKPLKIEILVYFSLKNSKLSKIFDSTQNWTHIYKLEEKCSCVKKKFRSKAFSVNLLQLKQKNLIIFLKSLIFCFKQKTLIFKAFHLNFFSYNTKSCLISLLRWVYLWYLLYEKLKKLLIFLKNWLKINFLRVSN